MLGQFSGHILQLSLSLKFSLDLKLKMLMMYFASETLHCSLLFFSLFTIISQTLAKPFAECCKFEIGTQRNPAL